MAQFKTSLNLLFFMLICFTIFNCNQDDLTKKEDILIIKNKSRVQLKTGNDVSQKVISYLKQKTNSSLSVSLGKNFISLSNPSELARQTALGTINTEKELVVENEFNTKHTFIIINDGDTKSVINVIVVETSETIYEYFKKYIFEDKINVNKSGSIDFGQFSGTIETYNSFGEITGVSVVELEI